MVVEEVIEKLRRADKVTVRDGMKILFCGNANQCSFEKDLLAKEVDGFYPELLSGLVVNLKKDK